MNDPLQLAENVIERTRRIVPLMPTAVLAVRSEMEMPLDRVFYEAQWQEQIRKMEEAWAEAKARINLAAKN